MYVYASRCAALYSGEVFTQSVEISCLVMQQFTVLHNNMKQITVYIKERVLFKCKMVKSSLNSRGYVENPPTGVEDENIFYRAGGEQRTERGK